MDSYFGAHSVDRSSTKYSKVNNLVAFCKPINFAAPFAFISICSQNATISKSAGHMPFGDLKTGSIIHLCSAVS